MILSYEARGQFKWTTLGHTYSHTKINYTKSQYVADFDLLQKKKQGQDYTDFTIARKRENFRHTEKLLLTEKHSVCLQNVPAFSSYSEVL